MIHPVHVVLASRNSRPDRWYVCVCVQSVSLRFARYSGTTNHLMLCVCVCVFVRLCSQYCFVALAPQNCAYGLSSFSADGTSLHIGTMVDVCLTLHGVFKFCLTLGSQNSAQALKKQTWRIIALALLPRKTYYWGQVYLCPLLDVQLPSVPAPRCCGCCPLK